MSEKSHRVGGVKNMSRQAISRYHLFFNPNGQLVSPSFPQDMGGKWVALGSEGFRTIRYFKISRKSGLIDSGTSPPEF